jgi:serine/threonine protein kinase
MNNLYEGVKVPISNISIEDPEAMEVSLKALQSEMDDTQLDFLRACLVIDGSARPSVDELLEHPYFDAEFRQNVDIQLQEMATKDI